ncbi:GNAT family N-acetyltransferase [uncultured Roseobacter sp.]|uniref:GNAT family N-acetyltransferase n=1 Tax=uncultured Roseobacter sp. TaxID=114847 RepID=UPI0026387B31|nr:GNAT family N-acetyltransferase [uncultured Roseobacter sp.]
MTPAQMAEIHTAAFHDDRPWSEIEFADLTAGNHIDLLTQVGGFALISTVAGESELLTLAVHPARQRQGIATTLIVRWLSIPRIKAAFLEVAADNDIAQSLYVKHGFAECGRREGYYKRRDRNPVDAVIMRTELTHG